jgi:hypothetical protein
MTLSEQQALTIVLKQPNGEAIKVKQEMHKFLKAHCTGIGDEELIEQIRNFERKEYGDTRKKLRMSNKDILARVMQPRNKIYTAKGGVESYTMSNLNDVEQFKIYLSSVKGTQSLTDFIKQNVQPMYDYDPEGLLWLDLNAYGLPVPCTKSIMQIWDYEISGRKPEYVCFALSDKEIKQLQLRSEDYPELKGKLTLPPKESVSGNKINKVFRVVCDIYDRIILRSDATTATILSEIPNPFAFMGVPGIIVSDIVAPSENGEERYDSCISPCTDILNQAMFGRSLYNVSMARNAYPKEWMTKMDCPTCSGTGVVGSNKCPECKGNKVMPFQMHSDVLVIDYGNDANKSIPTPPMGHIDPAVEALRYMHENNISWEDTFSHTMWGVSKVQPGNLYSKPAGKGGNVSNTAYEAQQNEQPKFDKLTEFSGWASFLYKWTADGSGKFIYGDSYIDSAKMFGTRYMIESADATFDRLVKARNGGATKSELDSLTLEYLENKYPTNPIEYRKYKVLFIAEPFYHDSTTDVISWNIPEINKMEKIFFTEWAATLDNNYFASVPDEFIEPKVKADLRAYVMGRVQQDATVDTLLFTVQGQLFNIGDKVAVKKGKELKPEHAGKSYKVSSVAGRYITLSQMAENGEGDDEGQGGDINGYDIADIIKM